MCPLYGKTFWADEDDNPVDTAEVMARYMTSYRIPTSPGIQTGTTTRDILICNVTLEHSPNGASAGTTWEHHVFLCLHDHKTTQQKSLILTLDNISPKPGSQYSKIPFFLASFFGLTPEDVLIHPGMCRTRHTPDKYLDANKESIDCSYVMYRHLMLAFSLPSYFPYHTDTLLQIDRIYAPYFISLLARMWYDLSLFTKTLNEKYYALSSDELASGPHKFSYLINGAHLIDMPCISKDFFYEVVVLLPPNSAPYVIEQPYVLVRVNKWSYYDFKFRRVTRYQDIKQTMCTLSASAAGLHRTRG